MSSKPKANVQAHYAGLLGLVVTMVAVNALAAPALARGDTVTEWNLNAANALMVSAGQPPQQSMLHMAMVHGAVYDAVNAIDGGHEGFDSYAAPLRQRLHIGHFCDLCVLPYGNRV